MMRGFQIRPQNSNRITFDPFLGINCTKLAKYPIKPISAVFFCKKGVKCCSILSLRPDLESSHRFASLKTTSDMIFTRGAESKSESESESESPGVVETRQGSESGSESTKLPRLWLRNVVFESMIYSLSMQGRIWMQFLKIICAEIIFKFFRYQGRSQRVATGTMHLRGSGGPTRTSYSLMLGHRSEFSWDAC